MSSSKSDSSDVLLDFKSLLVEKPILCKNKDRVEEFVWGDGDHEDVIPESRVDTLISELTQEAETIAFRVIGDAKFVKLKKIQILPAWIASAKTFENEITDKNLSPLDSIDGLCKKLKKKSKKYISSFFPVQTSVLSYLMPLSDKVPVFPTRDVAIAAPTGSGKTLCYILPILNGLQHQDPSSVFAVVVAPSVLLASQIYKEFKKYDPFDTSIVHLSGSQKYEAERRHLFPAGSTLAKASIIVATPDRLVQHLTDLTGSIDLSRLRYLVIDEADKMKNTAKMEWLGLLEERAHVFTPNSTSIDRLQNAAQNRWIQKILVSATLSLDAERLFIWNLRCPRLFCADSVETQGPEEKKEEVKSKENNEFPNIEPKKNKSTKMKNPEAVILPPTLKHKLIKSHIQRKPLDVFCWLQNHPEWTKAIVFVNTKLASQRLTHLLQTMFKETKQVAEVSTGVFGKRRVRFLTRFAEGKINVLVCTDSAARGLDVEGVDCVINYDLPKDNRCFVHRAGRTARAGRDGVVLSFVTRDDNMEFKSLLHKYGFWTKTKVVEDTDLSSTKDRSRYKKALATLEKITFEQADAEWKDVRLISPFTQTQSLLYEYAEHIAVHSFLKMVDLPFYNQQRPNAVDMSPTGRVPFLRLKEVLISDFPKIVNFVELKGIKLSNARTAAEQTDLEAYITIIDEDLRHVEMYLVWMDDETYQKVTKPRTASAYTFPVSYVLPRILRSQKIQYLMDRGFANKSMDEIIEIGDSIFQALSMKLGSKRYIIGDEPSELDCLAFGHIYTILTTELPNPALVNCLKKHTNLIEFCKEMEKELFNKTEVS